MLNNLWKFTEILRIEDLTFNSVLERFHNFGIDGLVRENIQNSLDGKLLDSTKPVEVRIETGKMKINSIPGIEEIFDRISVLKYRNEYTEQTIKHMKERQASLTNEADYISFEDSNTKGLTSASKGQCNDPKATWSAYAYNKGVHFIEEDASIEKIRGGSHGIGKIASNAASDFFVMFFSNCDSFGNQHIGGTVQLMEHEFEEKFYRATGYFTDVENNIFKPFENKFDSVFSKTTRGLKIVIPFLRTKFNNENDILKSICDNFFWAILNEKLVVTVNENIIDKHTIETYINNPDLYPLEIEGRNYRFTPYYLHTIKHSEPFNITIQDGNRESYTFKLFFNFDMSIPKGRLGIIRTIGMKIEDKKIRNNVNKPFNAVMIPSSSKEDSYLKSLENESHTQLSSEHIKNPTYERSAKTFINNISKELSKVIEQYIRTHNPTDGFLNTSDVLYDIETSFKQVLESTSTSLTINTGKENKTLVKVKSHDKKFSKKQGSKKIIEKDKGTRKVTKQLDGESPRTFYKIKPSLIQRAIINQTELIKIDLSHESALKNKKICDMYFTVIDGMGNEYPNEFNLKESYYSALDLINNTYITIDYSSLRNIPIHNSIVEMSLKTSDLFNNTLKFAYYLEV